MSHVLTRALGLDTHVLADFGDGDLAAGALQDKLDAGRHFSPVEAVTLTIRVLKGMAALRGLEFYGPNARNRVRPCR